MIYEMLIQTFQEGDWLVGTFSWIVFLFVTVVIVGLFLLGLNEIAWSRTPSFECEARLISTSFLPSTHETHTVPVATPHGVGVGVSSSGHDAEYITVWDCGQYGRLMADDERVFRYAKEKSTLYLKVRGEDARIVGLKVIRT